MRLLKKFFKRNNAKAQEPFNNWIDLNSLNQIEKIKEESLSHFNACCASRSIGTKRNAFSSVFIIILETSQKKKKYNI